MATTRNMTAGGYRFIPFRFQYSAAVIAMSGHAMERVVLRTPLPVVDGLAAAEAYLQRIGRPSTALAATELRSPGQFTEAGFKAFNEGYCRSLERLGLYEPATATNSVARSNVCPEQDVPPEPMLYAFCHTVVALTPYPNFVVAGSGEQPDDDAPDGGGIVRLGDTSPPAMTDKARAVLGVLERRMQKLGVGWRDATGVNAYTVYELGDILRRELVPRGAARCGVTWFQARPPVLGLEFELDCRAVEVERSLA